MAEYHEPSLSLQMNNEPFINRTITDVYHNGDAAERLIYQNEILWQRPNLVGTADADGHSQISCKLNGGDTVVTSSIRGFEGDSCPFSFCLNEQITSCRQMLKEQPITSITRLPDLSKVTNVSQMFYGTKLRNFDMKLMGNLDNVSDATMMLMNCPELESVDLSGYQIPSTANTIWFLAQCSNLKHINFGKDFPAPTHFILWFGTSVVASITTIEGNLVNLTNFGDLNKSPLTNESAMILIRDIVPYEELTTVEWNKVTYDTFTDEQKQYALSKNIQIACADESTSS